MDISVANEYYYGQVSCIDRQIEELQARRNELLAKRDAILRGHCYTGYHNVKSYIDPYNLADDENLAETTLGL